MNNDIDQTKKEFKVMGLSMENLSICYGLFLIIWGIIVSLISKSDSFTSYIPSFLGLPILIFSYLAIKSEAKKKIYMHIVVVFGLIIFFGGLDFLRSVLTGNAFENTWADISKLMMLLTGSFFTFQCIKSFIHARKSREINN
tara:strand:+ start:1920 stop:2345 length:426 start_codon:yes stop_codon:yes gene_type:complete